LPDTAVPAPEVTAVRSLGFPCRRFDCASAVRLRVSGELDNATAPQLDHALGRAQADAVLVILDLRELEFMDSSGVHLIVAASDRARQAGGRLVVVRGPGQVERIFALVGLERQLELVDHLPVAPGAAVLDGVQS
jgi:anti-sigma B factor antagonist